MITRSGFRLRVAAAIAIGALSSPLLVTAPVAASSPAGHSATVTAACPQAKPGTARCLALIRTDIAARPASAVSALVTPSGYGPADLQSAYALPSATAGSGMTVAIVDAFDLSSAESDLATYRSYYGLPACTTANGCFRKVDQYGGTSYPSPATNNWDYEIDLDLDMVSAACPNCNILLVEATDGYFSNLGTAVNTAVSLGAVAVSNSYGGSEGSGEAYYDSSYYNHPGVAITVATGDCGYSCDGSMSSHSPGVEYPAASPYVVAVGGTSLTRDGSSRGWSESAWGNSYGGAGSGCSLYEPKPSWQQDAGCSNRTQADVSAVADPVTGVAVYISGHGGWLSLGGTSAASPIVAATYALAGSPASGTYPASYLYRNPSALNDVTSGNNNVTGQTCLVTYLCNGVTGYDGPTGLGTPNGVGAFKLTSSTYHALTPSRLLDTRNGTGGIWGPVGEHAAQTFQVTGGIVPAGATAVTGNLTVTGAELQRLSVHRSEPDEQPHELDAQLPDCRRSSQRGHGGS
ncbi:MAG: peptidase S8 [Candidatus Limnocylindrales bacterium]